MNRRGFIRGMVSAGLLTAVPFKWVYKKTKQIYTGARTKLYINGKLVGVFHDVSFSHDFSKVPTLGILEVEELPKEVNFSVTVKSANWDKIADTTEGE